MKRMQHHQACKSLVAQPLVLNGTNAACELLPVTAHAPWSLLMAVTAAVAVLPLALLLINWVRAQLSRVDNWWQLHSRGPADLSLQLLQESRDKVVTLDTLHWGKITYIGRSDVAQQVFASPCFINRLGSDHGLKLLGMYQQGIIWNNDQTGWRQKRKFFAEGIQGLVQAHRQHAKQVCLAAFKQTLAEHCQATAAAAAVHSRTSSGTKPAPTFQLPACKDLASMPLSKLASAVAGIQVDLLPDGRDFFRLVTFRVTAALALGLPVDALAMEEARQVVYKVAAYFKAWEHFLLQPRWLCYLKSHTAAHKQHLAAVHALQDASTHLVNLAIKINTQTGSNGSSRTTITTNSKNSTGLLLSDTFLGKLLAAEAQGKLSRAAVLQLVLEMLLAGTDTSSVSLYYLMVQLQEDTQLEAELLYEVLHEAGDISSLSDAQLAQQLPISASYDSTLPRMQAALCEAMRFKPVGPVVIRQTTAPVTLAYLSPAAAAAAANDDDDTAASGAVVAATATGAHCQMSLCKATSAGKQQLVQLQVQAGETVIISLAAMHRDPTVFADPDAFSPCTNFQRHGEACRSGSSGKGVMVGASADVTASSNTNFRPFGHGRKGCVGRDLGWLEMKMMLACWLLTMRFRTPPTAGNAAAAGDTSVSPSNSSKCSSTAAPPQTLLPSKLSQMRTKWEVASQPVTPEPLFVRCVQPAGLSRGLSCKQLYIVGAGGTGKTTLCTELMAALQAAGTTVEVPGQQQQQQCDGTTGVARGWRPVAVAAAAAPAGDEDELAVDVQQARSRTPAAAAAASNSNTACLKVNLISETARQVMAQHGIDREQLSSSSKVFMKLQHLIVQQQLQQEMEAAAATGAGAGTVRRCILSDRSVVDALAYTADKFGTNSQELWQLLSCRDTQQLLSHCRASSSLVVMLPPYDGGVCPPVDDGVRLLTPTARLTVAFEAVLQLLAVPYEVVRSSGRKERVDEVLQLLGGWGLRSVSTPVACGVAAVDGAASSAVVGSGGVAGSF